LAIGIAILVWWAVAHYELVEKTLVASPVEVLKVLSGASGKDSQVWLHAIHTFKRALQGWAIAVFLGTFIGMLIGRTRALFFGSEPIIEFIRSVPPVIIFPLLLVVFNSGIESYVWTIALGCTPFMVLAVARRLQEISVEKMELLKLYKVAPTLRGIVMGMEIIPGLFLGSRLTLSIAIVISVVTEMVIAPRSQWALGEMAQFAMMASNTPKYFAAVLIIGGFGYLSNAGLRLVEERIGSSVGARQG
jgi:NitT/TauT family transport system permease protein